jgi:hypothetical protein
MTIVSAAALAAAGLAAAPRGGGVTPADPPRPVLDALGPQAYTPQTAREGAAVRSDGIPLPTGGNFNGIRWEAMDGEVPVAVIETLLQHNAACQWLRAWRRGSGTALDMLRRAASWSALRGSPIAAVVEEATRGGGRHLAAALAQCSASHAREAAYARQLGLTPST